MLLGISPAWKPTLENFIIGHNIELLSVLRLSITPIITGRGFYFWGEAGSGKSHLLRAAIDKARSLGLTAEYKQGMVPVAAQVVAIDDVELLDEAAQIELFALCNRQRETGGILLVSGPEAPAHLTLRDDLRTRLAWDLVYQVKSLSDEEKTQALQQHAVSRGFILPFEVTQYLLRHGRRDLPALLDVLDALDKHCLRLKRSASVPLLKEVMKMAKQNDGAC